MIVGVLALQGDVREHINSLSDCGVSAIEVKSLAELDAIDGQEGFGGLDVTTRRNAFGRQVDSFESDIDFKGITGPKFRAVFIRAPWIEQHGDDVEVLAEVDGRAVAVRSGSLLATSFHPELTGDNRIHRYFVDVICREVAKVGA